MVRKLFVIVLVSLAGCYVENARPARDYDRWWAATCGDVRPLGVGHDVTPPILIERVEPRWPRDRERGVIIVETVLTADGRVCAARIAKSAMSEVVSAAALDAVRQWGFTPAKLGGEPRAAFYAVAVEVR
ncbi:MAG TPA: energy transducer TonB [Thermoanaerobaculia bacterium]|nr:energy transducer TonB [Thermoanaerobaculia bacterium]